MNMVAARLEAIRAELARATRLAPGGPVGAIRLIAVSKTVGADRIRSAIEAGQRDFGENRVQEARAKWPILRQEFPDIRLHLIGPLQSNKAKDAVALFDAIHSVDRDSIAEALAAEMKRQDRHPMILVQVNIGKESQKAGVPPEDALDFVRRCQEIHGLNVAGLMCIPPADEPPGPYFALTAKLAREAGLGQLSMGMSGDYQSAICMGATMLRLGSSIFGASSEILPDAEERLRP